MNGRRRRTRTSAHTVVALPSTRTVPHRRLNTSTICSPRPWVTADSRFCSWVTAASPWSVTSMRMRPLRYVSSTKTGPSPWVIAFVTNSLVTNRRAVGVPLAPSHDKSPRPSGGPLSHFLAVATRTCGLRSRPLGAFRGARDESPHRVGCLCGRRWSPIGPGSRPFSPNMTRCFERTYSQIDRPIHEVWGIVRRAGSCLQDLAPEVEGTSDTGTTPDLPALSGEPAAPQAARRCAPNRPCSRLQDLLPP